MNFPFSPAEPAGFVVNFYVADRAALNVTDQPEQCADVTLTAKAIQIKNFIVEQAMMP